MEYNKFNTDTILLTIGKVDDLKLFIPKFQHKKYRNIRVYLLTRLKIRYTYYLNLVLSTPKKHPTLRVRRKSMTIKKIPEFETI